LEKLDVLVYETGCSGFQSMHSTTFCSVGPSSVKLDGPVSKIGGSRISRNSDESSKMMTADPDDWRTSLIRYLENPSHITDRKVRQQAMK
jgi:hypothetical protein